MRSPAYHLPCFTGEAYTRRAGRNIYAQSLVQPQQCLHPHQAVISQSLLTLEKSHSLSQRSVEQLPRKGPRLFVQPGKQFRDLGYCRPAITECQGT